jgi:ribosomal protein S15P/S13E
MKNFTKQQQKRFPEASINLQRMQEKIKRFAKYRKFKKFSTAGKWVDGTKLFT